jgi:hypothetical protein
MLVQLEPELEERFPQLLKELRQFWFEKYLKEEKTVEGGINRKTKKNKTKAK